MKQLNFERIRTNVVIHCTYEDEMVGTRVNFNGKNKSIYYEAEVETFTEELIDLLTTLGVSSFTLGIIADNVNLQYSTTRVNLINAINTSKGKNKGSIKNIEKLMSTIKN